MEPNELADEQAQQKEAEVTPVPGFEQEARENGNSPFSGASVMDLLQADLQEIEETKEVYIPLKGYGRTGLQVCYHLPKNGKELSDIARKVEREMKDTYSRNLTIAMDTMIHLCSGVYVQPPEVSEPVMLDPEETGFPCRYDERLARILGIEGEVQSARQVVRRLFGANDMAIISHAEKLNRWLQNTKADVSLEIWQVGE